MGELARFFIAARGLDCRLTVVPLQGYDRTMTFEETGLPWVMPSPNMPTVDTAGVYPGMVLLEGTTVSEGRGTTRPFEIFGAPYVEGNALCEELNGLGLEGVFFRPLVFEPTFHKFAAQPCGGAYVHVTDRARFRPYLCGLHVLSALKRLYPDRFSWRKPPYEYETEKEPIDILAGTAAVREAVDSGADIAALVPQWEPRLLEFMRAREDSLIAAYSA